jgi:hypothetical protein
LTSRRVIQASWDGCGEVDGGSIQDWAQELGLIFSRRATSKDEEEYSEIYAGDNMLEFERWMQVPSPPDGLPYR